MIEDKPHEILLEYVEFLEQLTIDEKDKQKLKRLLQKFLDAYMPYRNKIFVEKFFEEEEKKLDEVLKGYLK